ncbi:MAG: carbohydrate kinase, partial [Cytophagales bacterium]|nr:carbohydrate kinase [Cytophagales bacterium]
MDVTVIFDIGKTHKKFLLFDDQLNIISEHTHKTGELRDDDGDLCDDLRAITSWVRSGLDTVMKSKDFTVKKLNFSTYGASLVHLDGND